jgi:hypothetical protein
MAKRFTDSDKWEDVFFSELSNDNKIVWLYLLDKVNHAGVMKVNLRNLNFHCQTNFKCIDTVKELFNNRLHIVDEQYLFIPNFLKFQYSKGLNNMSSPIVSVKDELKKHSLIGLVSSLFGESFLTVSEVLSNSYPTTKDKEQDKEQAKDEYKVKDEIKKKETLEERKKAFKEKLAPYLKEYGKDMLNKFFLHFAEHNDDGNKMLFEKQKTWNLKMRLEKWKSREKPMGNFGKPNSFTDSKNPANRIDPKRLEGCLN